jgi:hypothetical protein
MGKGSRAFRRKATEIHDVSPEDVEFAELLDPIARVQEQVEVAPEVVEEAPPVASRFADTGIDDNRLPIRPVKRRSSRRGAEQIS